MSNNKVEDQLVSIIVPVYNAAQFLDKSISSLIRQTHKAIEIILIDDGSTDDSLQKCREYEKKDSRVRVLSNGKNLGQEATRNYGLSELKGQWLMFLDADDEFEANAVESMLHFAHGNGLDIVIAPYYSLVNGAKELHESKLEQGVYTKREFANSCLSKTPWDVISCVGSKLYRMDFIKKNQIFFDKRYKFNEDGAFILSALICADRVGYCVSPFYLYLIREFGSAQSSYRTGQFKHLVDRDDFIERYLSLHGDFTEKQSELLGKMRVDTASFSLRNEAEFGKYGLFCELMRQAQSVLNYDKYLASPGISGRQKMVLYAIKYNLAMPLFCFFKLRNILK